MYILLSFRGIAWQSPISGVPKDFSEVAPGLAPGLLLRLGALHVLEVAALAVGAARLVEVGGALLGLVLHVEGVVLPQLLHAVRELALVVVFAVSRFEVISAQLVFELNVVGERFLDFLVAVVAHGRDRGALWLVQISYSYHRMC